MLETVEAAIDAFGGPEEVRKATGISASAVSMWKNRGSIPPEYWQLFSSRLGDRLDPRVFRWAGA